MVPYIIKQAVEIKARFEHAPLTAPTEAHLLMGMLANMYGLPLPGRKESTSAMRIEILSVVSGLSVVSPATEKMRGLLEEYRKDTDVTDELYGLTEFGYGVRG